MGIKALETRRRGDAKERRGYVLIFVVAASAYLPASLVIHPLAPKLEPARRGEA